MGLYVILINALVTLLSTLLANATAHLPCSQCLQLSKSLEFALLEQDHTLHEQHAPPGQHIRVGRKIEFRTEKDVDAVLDDWCDTASTSRQGSTVRHDALHEACMGLLSLHRITLSNHILDQGWHQLRSTLCVDLVGACRAHELYDSGEL